MKHALLFTFLACAGSPLALAQVKSPTASAPAHHQVLSRQQGLANDSLPFDAALQPFYHGVASGDPLTDGVILWTRVTPEDGDPAEIAVNWFVATEVALTNIVAQGQATTSAARDYTVKVDVTGLQPGTTYYYYFSALGANSIMGKTKTLPVGDPDHLKFAVVSCSNYEAGYYNAYGRIADRTDLDAVIHLGDYIYEYGRGTYGDSLLEATRGHVPETEILTLADYRTRYSLYRLDPDLRRAHQQHPFLTIWDDHESANDAYVDGAQNHNEGEGDWEVRKAISKQVYGEWMPIRGNADTIYRDLRYGNLVDLIMLDTRLEGRDQQLTSVTDSNLYNPDRTMLGATQKAWFFDKLENATARWKVVANQVIFSEFNVGWAALADTSLGTPEQLESIFLDIWDGYPAERDSIIRFIDQKELDNVVILTGDFHSSFAYDVALRPSVSSPGGPAYNPATGAGSVAVEFATPSITSANFDENTNLQFALLLQNQINQPLPVPPPFNFNPNPHMKLVNLIDHGYFILDIKPDSAQANWFFADSIRVPSTTETFAGARHTRHTENRLLTSSAPSAPKAVQDVPAPAGVVTSLRRAEPTPGQLAVMSVYPNPADRFCLVQYAVAQSQTVRAYLTDTQGRRVRALLDAPHAAKVHTLSIRTDDLASGTYLLHLVGDRGQQVRKVIVQH